MTKELFILRLTEALEDSDLTRNEQHSILEDYTALIDEAHSHQEDLTAFIKALGSPHKIVRELEQTMGQDDDNDDKLVALSPFIAVILFFLLGFSLNAWHPGWLVFFLVPITAIATSEKGIDRLAPITIFFITIAYILIGTYTNLWHPFWALFILIPAIIMLTQNKLNVIVITVNNHPRTALPPSPKRVRGVASYTVLSVIAYLLGILLWDVNALFLSAVFAPPVIVILILSVKQNLHAWHALNDAQRTAALSILGLSGLITLGYIAFGLTTALWHPTWVIFMLIPITVLGFQKWRFNKTIELVSFTPFLAVMAFFILGEFFNLYHLAWLVFFIIPISGILFSHND